MKKFFDTLFKSLNPDAYSKLSSREFSEAFQYFFSVLFLAFVFMIVFALPMISKMPQDISSSLNDFYQFELDLKLDTKLPVMFPENNPKVIFDTTGKYTEVNETKAKFLITQNVISKKEGLCFWAEPFCFMKDSYSDYPINDYSDVIQNREIYGKIFTLLFVAALPVFFIIFYFVFVIKYLLLALAVSIIIFLLLLLLKHHTMYPVAFKIALYSTTILAVLEIALAPIFNFGYYSLVVYAVFNLIATYLASAHMIEDD